MLNIPFCKNDKNITTIYKAIFMSIMRSVNTLSSKIIMRYLIFIASV